MPQRGGTPWPLPCQEIKKTGVSAFSTVASTLGDGDCSSHGPGFRGFQRFFKVTSAPNCALRGLRPKAAQVHAIIKGPGFQGISLFPFGW